MLLLDLNLVALYPSSRFNQLFWVDFSRLPQILILNPKSAHSPLFRVQLPVTPFFSLNPKDDPLAAILMVDHYCIMTGEFDFLLRFYDLWQVRCTLATVRVKEFFEMLLTD